MAQGFVTDCIVVASGRHRGGYGGESGSVDVYVGPKLNKVEKYFHGLTSV
jgi:hypothetical protein